MSNARSFATRREKIIKTTAARRTKQHRAHFPVWATEERKTYGQLGQRDPPYFFFARFLLLLGTPSGQRPAGDLCTIDHRQRLHSAPHLPLGPALALPHPPPILEIYIRAPPALPIVHEAEILFELCRCHGLAAPQPLKRHLTPRRRPSHDLWRRRSEDSDV